MNRKETQGQNDISIIIGNLPRRLQEKFITREGKSNGSGKNRVINNTVGVKSNGFEGNVNVRSGAKRSDGNDSQLSCRPTEYGASTKPNCNTVTSIDYFLRLSSKKENESLEHVRPVSEASGPITNPKISGIETNVVVPGIIHLNAKKLNEYNNPDIKHGLRNHERRNRQQSRQEILSTRYEFPMSPVRNVQKMKHPSWIDTLDEHNAKRLTSLFEILQNAMTDNVVIENWDQLCRIRKELQDIFKNLLLNNLKFCCEQKVDSLFWKILFYNIREHLKQHQNSPNALKFIQEIITEGIDFYKNVYQKLCEKRITSETPLTSQRCLHKTDLMLKVTAQKLLIYLGDLWRYKVKDMQGQDYGEAENYYKKAQALVPSNGVPYNQLAILAIHNRKKFDAIYYHMRSLMASNAVHSAKQSLLILFDEIRKKYEETELKSSPLHSNYNTNNNQASKPMRKEVWIYPDGMRRLHRTDLNCNNNYKMIINEEKRFRELTTEELLRRITSLYLYIIGKLYTGVGMETILEHQRKLLLQFSVLLENESLVITRTRLMKMLALNIFIIELNLDKDTRRYHAFNFCNQLFGLLLRKTHELLDALSNSPNVFGNKQFLDLNTTLQYHRIYILWLRHHAKYWEPLKHEDHSFINSWQELIKVFNILEQRKLFEITEHDAITFEEDLFFMGFTPLVPIISKTKQDTSSEESLQLKARLKMILDFKEIYCANEKRLQNLSSCHFVNEDLNSDIKQALCDIQHNRLVKTESDGYENENIEATNEENINKENITNVLATATLTSPIQPKPDDMPMSQLSKLKKELEAKTQVKNMYHNKLEEILKFVDTKIYIEVRPKYLLPDTNCFIDCLEDFERIVYEFKCYTLVIPLIVVKELDGLSKGVKVESYKESLQKHRIHHYDDVSTRAKKSLDFIKTAKSQVRCATTKGSIINSSLFALVEEEHVSNDDKILATAIALSKSMSSETNKDGKCFIQTELVLITTDRNLRVKALSRNLAVSELPEFLQWAKECN